MITNLHTQGANTAKFIWLLSSSDDEKFRFIVI